MTRPDELSTAEKEARAPRLTPEQALILASASKVENNLTGQVQHDADGNLIDPAEQPAAVDKIAENKQFFVMLVGMATPALPFLAECYTDEVLGNIAGAYTAVEEKYGWNLGSMVGPELALALFTLPPTFAAYKLGKAHFAALRAQREAAEGRQPTKPPAQDARDAAIGAA